MKKITSSLLLTCTLYQSLSTAVFAMLSDFQSVDRYAQSSIFDKQTSLDFKANAVHTAAGVLFYMRDPEGDYSVILGQRDDSIGFCNFGGQSDEKDETLHVTAARECAEESMGLFAVHEYFLSHSPFADLYVYDQHSGDKKLYRMYLQEAEYVEESRFNQKLDESTYVHSQEYRCFKSFKARDLLKAVSNHSLDVQISSFETVTLYEPLYNMLSTPFYVQALNNLAKGKRPVPAQAAHHASYLKRADFAVLGDGRVRTRQAAHLDFEKVARQAGEQGLDNARRAKEEMEHIKLLQQQGHSIDAMKISPNAYAFVPFGEKEEKQFSYAEAFRQRMLMALKEKFQNKQKVEQVVESTLSSGRYTMTEGHLMLVLGHGYVEPQDISDPHQCRIANIENIKKYFKKYNKMEFINKVENAECKDENEEKDERRKSEFKRTLNVDARFIERLADVMDRERHEWVTTGRLPVYHGTTSENGHAFKIASIINNHLTLNSTNHLTRLRYTDLYFHNTPATMIEDMECFSSEHYENGNRDRRLFGNFVLTAGRQTSRSTSSTVEYWGNNHSVDDPKVKKRFEEGTTLLGMNLSYEPYESLYQQYIADTGTAYGNSLLLQMFITPQALNQFTVTEYMDEKVTSVAYQAAQAEYERLFHEGKEDFSPNNSADSAVTVYCQHSEEKKGFFGEVRLLLHPELMRDSSQFVTYSHDFFPLNEQKSKSFKDKLSAITAANLGKWFSQNTALIPGSLMETPTARNLYKMVRTHLTNSIVEDKPNTQSLLHLVRFGHNEGLTTLLMTCPDLIQSISHVEFFKTAYASGKFETMELVFDKIIQKPISSVLDVKHIFAILEVDYCEKFTSSFNYILENYDFSMMYESVMPATIKKRLGQLALLKGDAESISLVHNKIRPYTLQDIVDTIIPFDCYSYEFPVSIKALIDIGVVTEVELASLTINIMDNRKSYDDIRQHSRNLLAALLEEGLDVTKINQATGNPLFFDVCVLNQVFSDRPLSLLFPNGFLNVRNGQGLNVLEYALIEYKKGKSVIFGFTDYVRTALKKTGTSYKDYLLPSIYNDFRSHIRGNIDWLDRTNTFSSHSAQKWVHELDEAIISDNYLNIKTVFQDCPSSNLLGFYLFSDPEFIIMNNYHNLQNESLKELETWKQSVLVPLSQNENMESISNVVDKSPLHIILFCADKIIADSTLSPQTQCQLMNDLSQKRLKLVEGWKTQMNQALEEGKYSKIMTLASLPEAYYPGMDKRLAIFSVPRENFSKREKLSDELHKQFQDKPTDFFANIANVDFSLFSHYYISKLFEEKYADHTLFILNSFFKSYSQEERVKYLLGQAECPVNYLMQSLYNAKDDLKITRMMLDWAGCDAVIEAMSCEQKNLFLSELMQKDLSLLDYVFDNASYGLCSVEPGNDFFDDALRIVPADKLIAFIGANIEKLKAPGDNGFPRFFELHKSHAKRIIEIIQTFPTLLEFQTSLGFSLEELVQWLDKEEHVVPALRQLFLMKKSLQQPNLLT